MDIGLVLPVDVFRQPPPGRLPLNERLCEEPDSGELVIWHPQNTRFPVDGRFRLLCLQCLAANNEPTVEEIN